MTSRRIETTGLFMTVVVALAGTGCNSMLVGNWKTEPVPENAPFYIIQAEFNPDGLYQATANKDGEILSLRGVYDFNGFGLTLRSAGRPPRSYRASCWFGRILKLRHGESKLTMRKQ